MLSEDGFGVKVPTMSQKNLKMVGSVIYHITIEVLEELVESKNYYKESEDDPLDPVRKLVYQ